MPPNKRHLEYEYEDYDEDAHRSTRWPQKHSRMSEAPAEKRGRGRPRKQIARPAGQSNMPIQEDVPLHLRRENPPRTVYDGSPIGRERISLSAPISKPQSRHRRSARASKSPVSLSVDEESDAETVTRKRRGRKVQAPQQLNRCSSEEEGNEPGYTTTSLDSEPEDQATEDSISVGKPSKGGTKSTIRKANQVVRPQASSLTESQQLALDYPKFAVIKAGAKRKSEVTDDVPDLTTHYVSRQVRPNIKFTAEWTKEEEDRLWDRWTVNDELLLRATTDAECALWRKGQIVYGLALPDILPDDVHFDTSGNKPVIVPGTSGKMLENTNLSLDYTSILSTIFSCKPFMKDIEIFRYFIRYVLHMRLPKVYTKPSSSQISSHNTSIVEEIKKQSELLGMPIQREQETLIRTILNKEYSQQKFKYNDFLIDLKTQCQNSFSSKKPGLMRKDIHNIVRAWDETYVQSSSRKHLKTMAEYQKEYNNSGKIIKGPGSSASLSSGNDKVLRDKRNWIMASRRQDAINSKGSTADTQLELVRGSSPEPEMSGGLLSNPSGEEFPNMQGSPAMDALLKTWIEDLGE